jgi:hypothetical protein
MEAAACVVNATWSIGPLTSLAGWLMSMCRTRFLVTDEARFLSSVTLGVNNIEHRCSSLNSRWLRQ